MFLDRVSTFLIAAVANGALAAYARWRYSRNRLHRVFAGMVAGAATYSVFLAGLGRAGSEAEAEAWVRFASGLSYLALFGFYWFSMVFTQEDRKPWARRLLAVSAALALSDVLLRMSGTVPAQLVRVADQGWFPGPDHLYFGVYVPVMAALVGSALWVLWSKHRSSASGLQRRQIAYVFLAIGSAFAFSLLNFWPQTAFLAAFSPVIFTLVLGYGITRNQLLEMRLLLRQGALGAVLSAVLTFFLALTLLVMRSTWSGDGSAQGWISLLAAALLFTFAYEPLRRVSARLLDRLFELEDFDAGGRLLAYANLASHHPRIEDLVVTVCQRLQSDHGLERVQLLLPDRDGLLRVVAASPVEIHSVPALAVDSFLLRKLAQVEQGLDLDEISWVRRYELDNGRSLGDAGDEELRLLLQAAQCQLALLLKSADGRAMGLLLLGDPANGRGLRPSERAFFAALASQLGALLDNAQLQGQVRHADRLHSLGTLAAGLAHELRNPLSSIMVFVQMLPERFHDGGFREKFNRVVQQELSKLNRLTEQLLQISRPSTQSLVPLDLRAQFERVLQLLNYQFRRKGVELSIEMSGEPWVRAAPDELGQVLINLLINALAVSQQGHVVRLSAALAERRVVIRVLDQGSGIAEHHFSRLFEPFFTTKADGSGLGLATSLRIIESFGGTLVASNRPEGGACFEINLPASEPGMASIDRTPQQRAG